MDGPKPFETMQLYVPWSLFLVFFNINSDIYEPFRIIVSLSCTILLVFLAHVIVGSGVPSTSQRNCTLSPAMHVTFKTTSLNFGRLFHVVGFSKAMSYHRWFINITSSIVQQITWCNTCWWFYGNVMCHKTTVSKRHIWVKLQVNRIWWWNERHGFCRTITSY